ncbi:MAG: DNA-directed RNA polymerase subunit N [Candidatus Diapherotrites archaeon]|nr:DNA-directed RNA polymerase subunit N [Candidatus Diapherotrites archaeon]
MIIPVRCFSCGSLIGDKYKEFKERVEKGEDPLKVVESMGITRYCCRRMLFTQVDLLKEIAKYKV